MILLTITTISGLNIKDCDDHFKEYNSCPTILNYDWLNQICCGHVRNKLHCVSDYNVTEYYITYGCAEDSLIEKGHGMRLIKQSNGELLKVPIPCDNSTYEESDRNSSSVRHAYCINIKGRCNAEGEQLGCQGGTTSDNGCACAPDYEPVCESASGQNSRFFEQHDLCKCVFRPCNNGTARNVSYTVSQCKKNPVKLDYDCKVVQKKSIQGTTTFISTSTVNESDGTSGNSTTQPPLHITDNKNLLWCLLLSIPVAIIAFIVCKKVMNCKIRSKQSKPYSSVSTHQHGEDLETPL